MDGEPMTVPLIDAATVTAFRWFRQACGRMPVPGDLPDLAYLNRLREAALELEAGECSTPPEVVD